MNECRARSAQPVAQRSAHSSWQRIFLFNATVSPPIPLSVPLPASKLLRFHRAERRTIPLRRQLPSLCSKNHSRFSGWCVIQSSCRAKCRRNSRSQCGTGETKPNLPHRPGSTPQPSPRIGDRQVSGGTRHGLVISRSWPTMALVVSPCASAFAGRRRATLTIRTAKCGDRIARDPHPSRPSSIRQ
jgi:hypothetical protein